VKFAIVLALFAILTGCVSKYKTDAFQAPAQTLPVDSSAYVTMAKDGSYGAKRYPNSGQLLSSATNAAISLHLTRVEVGTHVETIEEALSRADELGITYVFQPTILHWEDRATEWSGRPDRITIKIVVWDVGTREAISSTVLRASSKWATFGGDHPQDLLPGSITPYVNKLFIG